MVKRTLVLSQAVLRTCSLLLAALLVACSADKSGTQRTLTRLPARPLYHPPDAAAPLAAANVETRPPPTLHGPALRDDGIRFVIEAAIARKELPGCVVAIGDHQGLRYLQAFGDRTVSEPMTVDTRFDLASLTKPLATAAAIMLLAERRVLDVDAPAHHYVRELAAFGKRSITIDQLLLHTSGLPKVNPLSAYDQGHAQAIKSIAAETLATTPGVQFEYSDLSFILLGEIVANVSAQDLAAFTESQLFAPLGMRDTHFRPKPGDAKLYAPTELREDILIRGEVDDPRAYRLGGVAGHAGLFSTAADIARFAQMLLRGGELDGVRVFAEETVRRFTRPERAGGAMRTLGFDVMSTYALGRGRKMSPRAFGHGGYTGTSLWIDPEHDLFVVLLSNRVHSGPGATIHPLASSIADLALAAAQPNGEQGLHVGIDVLQDEAFARLRGRSVAVLSHLPARDARGVSTLDVLSGAPQVTLKAILTPEHGLSANAEGHVANTSLAGVPVHSLFGRTRKPTAQMLSGVSAVVIDVVDVGTRFYTYMATVLRVLEAAAEQKLPVILLDRPNPLDGVHVEGPLAEASFASFVNYHPLPLRHGMTPGELARFLIAARQLDVKLHVVELSGWQRNQWFASTPLRWHAPSPNLHTPEQALLYPAVGLVEGTNLSVGRGTDRAFSVVGAPFLDPQQLAQSLEQAGLSGVKISPTKFRPKVGPYRGELLPGIALRITDPEQYSAARTGLALAATLRTLYPQQWDITRLPLLVARADTARLLADGAGLPELLRSAAQDLESFQQQRSEVLLYR